MEGGAKFLKKKHTKKQIKYYKKLLRSLKQKHVKTASAKLRKQHQIAQTMKKLNQLRGRTLRKRAPLRRHVTAASEATAVSTLAQKYASSHIQPIVSAHSSPASNLTVTVSSPIPPSEPSEHLGSPISPLSPIASSIETDTSITPAEAQAPPVNMELNPITMTDDNTDQGSLHLSDLGTPPIASPATTIATNSM